MKAINILIETVLALCFLIIFLGHSDLLSKDLSQLYSTSLAPRLQTDAFLKGHLSLSPMPFGYLRDFNWNPQGGLQQIWGLGVPLLRLPFEWVSTQLGFGPFPDRLVLLFYLIIVVILLNLSLRQIFSGPLWRWYVIAWMFLTPAVGGLIQRQINTVYYETVFYGVLYAYVLLAVFWFYLATSERKFFWILCSLAGFGCLVYPPLIVYGSLAVALASRHAYQHKFSAPDIGAGILLFGMGLAALLGLNFLRFGSPFDSGYSVSLCGYPVLYYSLLFDYPFHHEHFFSAAKELLGALFFNNAWPSSTVRFRWGFVGYYPPFNAASLIIVLVGIAALRQKVNGLPGRIARLSLLWGIGSAAVLLMAYLYLPFMNSRYLSAFAPAFAAVFIGVVLSFWPTVELSRKKNWLAMAVVMGLLFYIVHGPSFSFAPPSPKRGPVGTSLLNQAQLTDQAGIRKMAADFDTQTLLKPSLPPAVFCGRAQPVAGLMFQYNGWHVNSDCRVFAATSAFLPSARCITLDYTGDAPDLQVKRNAAYLTLAHSEGSQKTFCGEGTPSGTIALYSVAWVSPPKLSYDPLEVRLNSLKVTQE